MANDDTNRLFRGTKDVQIGELDHARVDSDGLWGAAMYLSRDPSVAKWYASKGCDYFGVMTEYSIPDVRVLIFRSGRDFEPHHPTDEFVQMTHRGREIFGKAKFPSADLALHAARLGYDAVDIQDEGRFGEPIFILLSGSIAPIKYHVYDIETEKFRIVMPEKAASFDRTIARKKKRFASSL